MRMTILITLLLFSLTAYAARPTDSQLDRYFELTGTADSYDSNVSSIYLPLIKMMNTDIVKVKEKEREKADRVAGKVSKAFTWENIKPKIYQFYKSKYTAEEIESYIKTLSRPDVQAIRQKEKQLEPEYNKVMQTITIQNLLQIAIETELEEAMKKNK